MAAVVSINMVTMWNTQPHDESEFIVSGRSIKQGNHLLIIHKSQNTIRVTRGIKIMQWTLKVKCVTSESLAGETKLHAFCRRTLFWLCFGSAWLRMNVVISRLIKHSPY